MAKEANLAPWTYGIEEGNEIAVIKALFWMLVEGAANLLILLILSVLALALSLSFVVGIAS